MKTSGKKNQKTGTDKHMAELSVILILEKITSQTQSVSDIPGIAKAVPHPAERCEPIPARVGSGETAAAGNTRLGSDPGGTP